MEMCAHRPDIRGDAVVECLFACWMSVIDGSSPRRWSQVIEVNLKSDRECGNVEQPTSLEQR